MEVLFFIIFGSMLIGFCCYGIRLYLKDKKLFNELQNQEKQQRMDWRDMAEEDACVFYSEQPFMECYKSLN
jgi:hypothetical protein